MHFLLQLYPKVYRPTRMTNPRLKCLLPTHKLQVVITKIRLILCLATSLKRANNMFESRFMGSIMVTLTTCDFVVLLFVKHVDMTSQLFANEGAFVAKHHCCKWSGYN